MHSFDTPAAIAAAPTTASIDARLRQLLADRVADWTATDLLDLTHLLIVQPGDTEEDIEAAVGFSPLVNALAGGSYPAQGYVPPFEWVSDVGGYFELIQTVGNSGFAFCLLVQDAEGVDPELLAMCRAHARHPSS